MDKNCKKNLLKRIITLCWISLIGCLVIKLFGGDYFKLMCDNESFKNLCNWIDGNFVKEIIRFIFANMCFYIYTCSIIKRKMSKKELIIFELSMIIITIAKYITPQIGFIADSITMIIIPLKFSKWNWKSTILGFLLINAFQLISLFIRNLGITILEAPILVELLLQVDYYIMLILYYLYSVKLKGENKNG